MSEPTIKSRSEQKRSNDAYREGWDRIFGNNRATQKPRGGCLCGSTKYPNPHYPHDHAGWKPDDP